MGRIAANVARGNAILAVRISRILHILNELMIANEQGGPKMSSSY